VYRLQGVKINDKHIRVIVKQMLQKVRIVDSGDTEMLEGEHVDRAEFRDTNETAKKHKVRPATAEPLLLGITKAGLKENIIIGHLIPAGTGMYRYQEVDVDSDALPEPEPIPAALEPSFEAMLPPSFAESLPFTMGDEPL